MPNWCATSAVIYGKTKDVEAIKKFIEKALMDAPYKEADNPHTWLGQLVVAASGDKSNCFCRGWIHNISDIEADSNEESHFFIDSDDAWGPILPKVIDHVIFHKFHESSLQRDYIAEEPGCEIYVNTDTSGVFFPERYLIIDDDGYHYFESEEELYAFLKEAYDCRCTTPDEVIAWTEDKDWCTFIQFEAE